MSKKVIILTGCSDGGIGWQLCKEFINLGHIVYATARTPSKVTGLDCQVLQLDVQDETSIETAIQQVVKEQGRIDILINTAGQGLIGPSVELSQKHVQTIFDVNVFGLLAVSKKVARVMIDQNSGLIVNFGSVAAFNSTPWGGAYSASKAAVHSFTQSMRMELAPFGVNVTLVCPGKITSNIGANNVNHNIDIPPDTLYGNFEELIKERAMMSQQGSTPTQEFCDNIVPKILSSTPPREIYYGAGSTFMWFTSFLPGTMVDKMFMKNFKVQANSEVGKSKEN